MNPKCLLGQEHGEPSPAPTMHPSYSGTLELFSLAGAARLLLAYPEKLTSHKQLPFSADTLFWAGDSKA